MVMTNEQLQQAIQMHDVGIKWELIAAFFKTNTNTLRRRLKQYEQQNNQIH